MESPEDFMNYMRMEPAMFREVLIRLSERIRKKTTRFRAPFKSWDEVNNHFTTPCHFRLKKSSRLKLFARPPMQLIGRK